jgi:hypothetical protein
MKKIIIRTVLAASLFISASALLAQGPPPPPVDPESGGGPVGGPAPVGTGIGILLTLGAAYGGRKLYKAWKDSEALEE